LIDQIHYAEPPGVTSGLPTIACFFQYILHTAQIARKMPANFWRRLLASTFMSCSNWVCVTTLRLKNH
jgi:hypothetical protein